MSDNNITQDQLEPNVMEELESGIGDLSTLSTENKDSLVAAVTEIYGKNVIAEAIGEPLAVTDTFSEMGSEINSLLSSFKTNMMNSGVTVESGDKFKQLIDKIKGLTEGEGNKGIQFAQGNGKQTSVNTLMDEGISVDIDFEPMYLFLAISNRNTPYYTSSSYHGGTDTLGVAAICISDLIGAQSSRTIGLGSNVNGAHSSYYYDIIFNTGLTDGKITVKETRIGPSWIYGSPAVDYDWYAIGVGEEDTTLRDSLADILENKGVDVTEEDDMASLISKVDDMTSNMIKYKSGIHEYTYDGNTSISFEVTGIGFRPTFVQICRVNKTATDGGYAFWINNAYMNDSNSIYIPVESISDLKSTSYSSLSGAGAKYNEIVVNDDGFSLNIYTGGTAGHLWHFEWFVLG